MVRERERGEVQIFMMPHSIWSCYLTTSKIFAAVALHVQLNLSFQGSCGCGTDSRGRGSPVLQTHSAQFPPHGTVAWQPVETDELPTSATEIYCCSQFKS